MDRPTFREFFRYWLTLGFVNFGGPAGQIAMLHRDLVERLGWIEERLFQRALGFCMLLPGPEAHQLAVYIGWRLFGVRGGVVSGLFFLLPSVALMLGLSWLAAAHGGSPLLAGVFRGVAGAVVAIVAQAVWRMARKSLGHPVLYGFAAASFLMGFALKLKLPGIVVAAGLMGAWLGTIRPDIFCPGGVCPPEDAPAEPPPPVWPHLGRVAAAFAGIWLLVGLPTYLFSGPDSMLPKILGFYSRASFVTFGGAYAVLSYVQDMALRLAWVGPEQLVFGLGLAETTPGPLVMVTQYVGFLTAWNHPGGLDPLTAGVLGGLLTTFGMFLPSFCLVFAGAPFIAPLTASPRLRAMFTGVAAAIVGVILKLAASFALAAFAPKSGGIDLFAVGVALAAGLALWRTKAGVHVLVLACGAAGAAWTLLG